MHRTLHSCSYCIRHWSHWNHEVRPQVLGHASGMWVQTRKSNPLQVCGSREGRGRGVRRVGRFREMIGRLVLIVWMFVFHGSNPLLSVVCSSRIHEHVHTCSATRVQISKGSRQSSPWWELSALWVCDISNCAVWDGDTNGEWEHFITIDRVVDVYVPLNGTTPQI